MALSPEEDRQNHPCQKDLLKYTILFVFSKTCSLGRGKRSFLFFMGSKERSRGDPKKIGGGQKKKKCQRAFFEGNKLNFVGGIKKI